MFEREHHIHVATILQALNADLLAANECLFGGGTAIVLSHGEYRESADIDFLVSHKQGYQTLRTMMTGNGGIQSIVRPGMELTAVRDIRADQYGIRTLLRVADTEIKFEIVLEARIDLEAASADRRICGVATLTALDMAATKILANSDRWADDGVFSRDLIDLAMMDLNVSELTAALGKAAGAYGENAGFDLVKAIDALAKRRGRLEECMDALKMDDTPKALLWERIRRIKSV